MWRHQLVQRRKHDDFTTYVRPPPEGEVGTEVYDSTMDATSGLAWDRSRSTGPSFYQRRKRVDPIGPEELDSPVYHFSKDNMGVWPVWHDLDKGPDSKSTSMQWNYNY